MTVPLSIAPTSSWNGNDGLWNTFRVSVGTPPQEFRILPSTAGQETWLPNPEGCTTAEPSDPGYCGYLRGTLPYHGANSSGFQTNLSSTWDLIGLYTLDAQESALGYGGNGLYGFDTVTLGIHSTTLTKQVVASVPDLDYWLGIFGLGPKSINFTTFNNPIPSYLSELASSPVKIPSLSWAYTAGAYYRNKSAASLTLGGYDSSRSSPANLTFDMNADNSRPLQVAVQKIIGQNTLGGAGAGVNMLPTATYHFLDSTLPHIWLPDDAIQAFVDNFGLMYDGTTDLYLINDTMRSQMLQLSPTVIFVFGNSTVDGSGDTVNIELPYAAFDLQTSYPYYQNATNYFPIRRAANESQYTIGRTFFQEAYVIADHERNNFTVAQATAESADSQNLVAIEKPVQQNSSSSTSTSRPTGSSAPLSSGALAGVVVGAIVGVSLCASFVWLLLRRNKHKHQPVPTSNNERPEGEETVFFAEKNTHSMHKAELSLDSGVHEASDGRPPAGELSGQDNMVKAEMEGDMGRARARPGMVEMSNSPTTHEVGVVTITPVRERIRYELAGSELTADER